VTDRSVYFESVTPFRCAVILLLNPLPGMTLLRMDEYRLGPDDPPLVDFSPFPDLSVPDVAAPNSDTAAVERQRQAPITHAASAVVKETSESKAPNRSSPAKTVPVFSVRKPDSEPGQRVEQLPTGRSEIPFPQATTTPVNVPEPSVTRQINIFVEQLLSSQTDSGKVTPNHLAARSARIETRSTGLLEKSQPDISQKKPLNAGRSYPGSAVEVPISAAQYAGGSRPGYIPEKVETGSASSTQKAEKAIVLIEKLADVVLASSTSPPSETTAKQSADRSISRRKSAAISEFPPANGNGKRTSEFEFLQVMSDPFRSEWPNAYARESSTADAPSVSANHDTQPGTDLRAFADTPEKIVDLVTDALVEQARRNGVDMI
jgi:hypothetical protein